MQTVAQRSSFAGAVHRCQSRVQARRTSVVVRADAAETRRAVLSGLLASAVALTAGRASASPIELFDDRKAVANGFDIIYEARDLDLDQATRDGFTESRSSIADTKKRVAESEKRLDVKLDPFIKKQYWTLAREELRLQLGTLRFDLNTLAGAKPKAEKKKALLLKDAFFSKADELDFAIRNKDLVAATTALSATQSSLDSVIAFLS